MIRSKDLFEQLGLHLNKSHFRRADSLLKSFCAYVTDHAHGKRHVIAANEGGAIALATGHYLATGEYAGLSAELRFGKRYQSTSFFG